MMGTLFVLVLVALTALFCAGITAVLVIQIRRDLRLWRGEGVSVEGRVIDHVQVDTDDGAGKFALYEFTAGNGRKYKVRDSISGVRRAPLGSARRLVYLPGAEQEAEPAGLGIRLFVYPVLIAASGGSGWFLVRLLTG